MAPTLRPPILCLVTDRHRCGGRPLEAVVEAAVEGGVNMIQLRERDLAAGPLLELALRLRALVEGRALLVVNDRADVALAADAHGVQLGEAGMPVGAARRVVGDGLLIGRSVHSPEGAVDAQEAGADFLVLGTVFATASHPEARPGGLDLVRRTRPQVGLPLLGIGGINADNAGQVVEAGADGVAVITALTMAPDPREAARRLWRAVAGAWSARTREGVRES